MPMGDTSAFIGSSGQTGLAPSRLNIDEVASEKAKFNQAITQAAQAVVAYATRLRPISNPDEFMAIVDSTLENCALSTIQRIDPQTGRLRGPVGSNQAQTQALQAQAQVWRQVALQASGRGNGQSNGRSNGNGRSRSRQTGYQNFGYQGAPLSMG